MQRGLATGPVGTKVRCSQRWGRQETMVVERTPRTSHRAGGCLLAVAVTAIAVVPALVPVWSATIDAESAGGSPSQARCRRRVRRRDRCDRRAPYAHGRAERHASRCLGMPDREQPRGWSGGDDSGRGHRPRAPLSSAQNEEVRHHDGEQERKQHPQQHKNRRDDQNRLPGRKVPVHDNRE